MSVSVCVCVHIHEHGCYPSARSRVFSNLSAHLTIHLSMHAPMCRGQACNTQGWSSRECFAHTARANKNTHTCGTHTIHAHMYTHTHACAHAYVWSRTHRHHTRTSATIEPVRGSPEFSANKCAIIYEMYTTCTKSVAAINDHH